MTTTLTSTGFPPRSDYRGPIKFEVYRRGQRLTTFDPVGAVAMGPESVPVPAEVSFREGLLTVNRKDDQPVGVRCCGKSATTTRFTSRPPACCRAKSLTCSTSSWRGSG